MNINTSTPSKWRSSSYGGGSILLQNHWAITLDKAPQLLYIIINRRLYRMRIVVIL